MDKVFVVFLVFLVTALFIRGLSFKFQAVRLANDPAVEASYSGDLFHRISEFCAAGFIVAFLFGLL